MIRRPITREEIQKRIDAKMYVTGAGILNRDSADTLDTPAAQRAIQQCIRLGNNFRKKHHANTP